MGEYRSLRVWQLAHELALSVYSATSEFPASELYGLTSQLRRSAASVPSNIAEGCGRDTDPELRRFCRVALGSANELDYQLLLARDLQFLQPPTYHPLAADVERVKRMLARLIDSLSASDRRMVEGRIALSTDSRQPTADS